MKPLAAFASALAALLFTGTLHAQVPQLVNYQGRVAVGTANFNGPGLFKFALVNAAGTTTYWSNDGTSAGGLQPAAAVSLTVTKGLYSVLLGDTSLANMTGIPSTVWANADVRLRVWFNDGANGSQQLTPDQRLATNGYLPDGGVTNAKLASPTITINPGTGLAGGGGVSLGGSVTLSVNVGTGANQIVALNASGQLPALSGVNLTGLSGGNLAALSVPLGALAPNSVDSSKIVDGSIVNADISAAAAIVDAKLATIITFGKVANTATTANSLNTANSIVARNAVGGFSAGAVTVTNSAIGIGTVTPMDSILDVEGDTHINGFNIFLRAGNDRNHGIGHRNLFAGQSMDGPVLYGFGGGALGTNQGSTEAIALSWDTAGNISVGGNLNLGVSTLGVIRQGGIPLIHTFGNQNFFAGSDAGNFLMTGSGNTATGTHALFANTTGNNNTVSGSDAFNRNMTGNNNTASGYQTMSMNESGNSNTASGVEALFTNQTGSQNTASGYQALYFNTTDGNTATGYQALRSNTNGNSNTAFGWQALLGNTSAARNTAIGNDALSSGNTGNSNTAIGDRALNRNGPGSNNTASGAEALFNNSNGSNNTAGGYQSLNRNNSGNSNAAFGTNALNRNQSGNENTASGTEALFTNTAGSNNTASGYQALYLNTADGNTASGYKALRSNTTGSLNTATGINALFSNLIGNSNTAIGDRALFFNDPGNSNTASGGEALFNNRNGSNNTASGYRSLYANVSGNSNTAFGTNALAANTTGASNIALGNDAGNLLTTGSNNIDIGNVGVAAEAATIRIGTAQTRTFVAGIRGVTTVLNNAIAVLIDSNGQLGTVSSSRRYKEDIADMGDASARLLALRPVTFRYKQPYANGEKPVQYGLIAEEVAEAFPELAVFNDQGQPETVKYQDLTPLLLNEVQKLRAEKDALKEQLAVRDARDRDRDARIARLESLLPPANPKGN